MMEIDNRKVPFTATHYCLESREFLGIGKGQYAEVFLNDKYWYECPILRNAQLPKKYTSSECGKYMRIFKTGMARDFCNIRLFLIGSSYRIK